MSINPTAPTLVPIEARSRFLGSIYAGDTMVGRGRAVDKRCSTPEANPRYLVDLEITVTNQRGEICCPAAVTIEVLQGR